MKGQSRLSRPIESLIDNVLPERDGEAQPIARVAVVIVGSGYGGSIAATRLAGRGRRVVVLERGREYGLGDFPVGLGQVPGHVRFHRTADDQATGYADALFDLRLGDDIDVLVGSGLGGTSLINANVAVGPAAGEFSHVAWPRALRDDAAGRDAAFREVADLLGVARAPITEKFKAFQTLATSLTALCEPAPVTVTFGTNATPRLNSVGVAQTPCTMCGNCVTGCNVGAKNTLMMNALPLAVSRDAEIYTGVTVLSVRRDTQDSEYPWIVRLRRTASEKTPLQDEIYHLAARDVILAAGTLGSTEILMRSRRAHRLAVSDLLATRFSGNGDALAFSFAQRERVHAIGEANQSGCHTVGPTITGLARHVADAEDSAGRPAALTIEDGAVPTSLAQIFGEGVTTAAMFQRLASPALPAWHRDREQRGPAPDPLVAAGDALQHSQVLLVMGDDGAAGTMQLRMPSDGPRSTAVDRAHLVVDWPSAANNASLRRADRMLKAKNRQAGFDGGQYVPSPLWRLLPEEAASVMSGALPGGRAITVHPLGGCPMGDTSQTGVVNDRGQVFDTGPNAVGHDGEPAIHDGLHVLDGSIVPKALGVNPLLTISALAWRAAEKLRSDREWPEPAQRTVSGEVRSRETLQPRQAAIAATSPGDVEIELKERLSGKLTRFPQWLERVQPYGVQAKLARWRDPHGLVLRVTMPGPGVAAWLAKGTDHEIPVTASVYAKPPDQTGQTRPPDASDADLDAELDLVARGSGRVALLKPDRVNVPRRLVRAGLALVAYHTRRETLGHFIRRTVSGWLDPRPSVADPDTPVAPRSKQVSGFLKVAWQHAIYRRLQYRIEFHDATERPCFTLTGEKVLAWSPGTPRLWDSLLNLPFTLQGTGPMEHASGRLAVDIDYFASAGIPQVRSSPHLPATIIGLARIAMLFARSLLQTHFWDFGAPTYPDRPLARPTASPPLRVGDSVLQPETMELSVALYGPRNDRRPPPPVRLRLTRYRDPGRAPGDPVLLIHGLAQGSLIYSTDTIDVNMASALSEAGYDVWLLDYRLSNMLPALVPEGGWSMDDIARYDIPAAIDHVYRISGGRPVRIFAHCVGATTVAMAILKHWVNPTYIACLALNAIHPWTIFSVANRVKARLGSFFRDVLQRDLLDPIPGPRPSVPQTLLDRLAFSLARYEDAEDDRLAAASAQREPVGRREEKSHTRSAATVIAETVCDRMTFLYARMWRHSNLDPRTHASFSTLVGPAPGDVYRQLYFFALRERLTTQDGLNDYLTKDNLCKNWRMPTVFFHGEESRVFSATSATRSAENFHQIVNVQGGNGIPVTAYLIPGYGHMDVIFGKNADRDVFRHLIAFFRDPGHPPGAVPTGRGDDRPGLSAGPILRAAWTEDGTVYARLWAEANEDNATLVDDLALANSMSIAKTGPSWLTGVEERDDKTYALDRRYRLMDVALDARDPITFQLQAGALSKAVTWDGPPPWLQRLREAAQGGQCHDMRFIVGSCRYPGTPFERDASDLVFGGIREHLKGRSSEAAHLLFLVGDQIYADATANILDAEAWRERYCKQYRDAFTTPRAREVLAQVPTHFAIDDHELVDNWSGQDPLPPSGQESRDAHRAREIIKHANRAASFFQGSGRDHSPIGPVRPLSGLWYALDDVREHCCPTFVMNTRSERGLRRAATGRQAPLVSLPQLAALKCWLRDANRLGDPRRDMPKFIVCGVGIAPIGREYEKFPDIWRSNDWWLGYPGALTDVLGTIIHEKIPHVVFVSGDLHLSSVSKLTLCSDHGEMIAWQIVSSGLYAPMPFANADLDDYDWNRPVRAAARDDAGSRIDICAESGVLCSGAPHFLRVDAEQAYDGWSLSVRVGGHDGAPMQPLGPPPDGVGCSERSWRIHLPRLAEGHPGVEQPAAPAPVVAR
jgi:cholesterol oxidase